MVARKPDPLPPSVGYSGTPLPRKLGLKDGQRVFFAGLPPSLAGLAKAATFAGVEARPDWRGVPAAGSLDVVHAFFDRAADLAAAAKTMMDAIRPDGMIWVSWPKKASGVPTDITEDVIRSIVLPVGLVDVKVCAVDETWSGLKLVIRKELRAARAATVG